MATNDLSFDRLHLTIEQVEARLIAQQSRLMSYCVGPLTDAIFAVRADVEAKVGVEQWHGSNKGLDAAITTMHQDIINLKNEINTKLDTKIGIEKFELDAAELLQTLETVRSDANHLEDSVQQRVMVLEQNAHESFDHSQRIVTLEAKGDEIKQQCLKNFASLVQRVADLEDSPRKRQKVMADADHGHGWQSKSRPKKIKRLKKW